MEEVEAGYKSTSVHLGVPVIWTEHIRFLPDGENVPLLGPLYLQMFKRITNSLPLLITSF